MAEQYTAYCKQFGYPPKQAKHLIAFAKRQGVNIKWKDASAILRQPPSPASPSPDASEEPPLSGVDKPLIPPNEPPANQARISVSAADAPEKPLASGGDKPLIPPNVPSVDQARISVFAEEPLSGGGDKPVLPPKLPSMDTNDAAVSSGVTDEDDPFADIGDNPMDSYVTSSELDTIQCTDPIEKKTHPQSPKPKTSKGTKHQTPPTPKVVVNEYPAFMSSQWYQYSITQLTKMGWDKDQSIEALIATNGNLQLTIEALMSGEVMKHQPKPPAPPPLPQRIPPSKPSVEQSVGQALDQLSTGHASIKQRLIAMDTLYKHLEVAVSSDHGQRLMTVFVQQLMHEDYIYRDHAVRIKALEQIADVCVFCLHKVDYNDKEQAMNMNESMGDILNHLFLLLDDNSRRKFHKMVKESVVNIVNAVMEQKNTTVIVNLCGMLNEKAHCDHLSQSNARLFAVQQIFETIVFGFDEQLVKHMFNINVDDWSSTLVKYTNGIAHDTHGLPSNSAWLRVVIADEWESDEEETFKDIIADTVSVMMMDPNGDIAVIGFNLAVYLYGYNNAFVQHLDAKARDRFLNYLAPKSGRGLPKPAPIEITEQQIDYSDASPMSDNMNQESPISVSSYRINAITPISVSSPSMPDL
eukprot:538564_1